MSLKIIGQLAEIYIPAFQSQGNGSAITETVALDSYRQATDTKNDDKRSTLPWWITGLAGLASSIFLSDLHQASSMNAEEITDQADRAFLNGTVDLQYKRYETASTEFQKAYDLYSSVDSSFGRLKSLLALGKTQFLRNDGKAAKDTFNDVNE
ncbi:hypothetical protein KKA47_03185, partial [bacterium]|nr:hypothetical protein [bacterium]